MDASIGLIMQKLEDLELLNNTLVIFTRYVLAYKYKCAI